MPYLIPQRLDVFPHPELADSEGLLAFSTHLTPESLLLSYRFGIFPWYHQDDPVMWWYTHPRFVLFPNELKISKSLRRSLKKTTRTFSMNKAFEDVIFNCQTISRKGQESTWITQELKDAFIKLHKLGYAHSVETWNGDKLVGGIYGMALGKIFYGESMFALESNASKMAFVQLVEFLKIHNFKLIDCQQETAHLASLGARSISSKKFLDALRNNIFAQPDSFVWRFDTSK